MIKKQAKIKSYLVTKITKKLDFWHHNIKNERTHYLFQVSIYIRQLLRLYCILYHQVLKISPKKDHGTNLSRMTQHIQVKNNFLVINVTRLSQMKETWRDTWEHTQPKSHFLAITVLWLSHKQEIWRNTWDTLWWKTISLQSMSQGILSWTKFEDTLKNTLRWKTISL